MQHMKKKFEQNILTLAVSRGLTRFIKQTTKILYSLIVSLGKWNSQDINKNF